MLVRKNTILRKGLLAIPRVPQRWILARAKLARLWTGIMQFILQKLGQSVLYPYKEDTRNEWSNIALRLREFPRAKPEELPKAKGYIWQCNLS